MESFIVLGIVPGTDFQLTLEFWIAVAAVLLVLANLSLVFELANRARTWYVAQRISIEIMNFDLRS